MSGHALGKWRISGVDVVDGDDHWRINGVVEVEGCSYEVDCKLATVYSSETHARVVAAAPELLEALRSVLPYVVTDVLEHCDGNKCREPWCAGCCGDEGAEAAVADANAKYRAARAAIAKATGGAE